MIVVDWRRGSKALIEPLQQMGLDVAVTELPFGDVAFEGRGEGGAPVQVGIEFKQLEEAVGSMRTGRFEGHQLLGMQQAYQFRWLMMEGEFLWDTHNGRLLKRAGRRFVKPIPGGMTLDEFQGRLFTLQMVGGTQWLITKNRIHTLQTIRRLYRWWTDMDMDAHKSHLAIYQPPELDQLTQMRRTVATLPGVSLAWSAAFEEEFGEDLEAVFAAPVSKLAKLAIEDTRGTVRHLGEKIALRIRNAIKGVH